MIVPEPKRPPFSVTTASPDMVGLRKVCERYINSLWLAEQLSPDERAAFALDLFKRAVAAELELLNVQPS